MGLVGATPVVVGYTAAGLFLYALPGWGLLTWFWPGWGGLRWLEKLALACGLSLALYPMLFLGADLLRLHPGALFAWLPPLIGLALLAGRKFEFRISKFEISWSYRRGGGSGIDRNRGRSGTEMAEKTRGTDLPLLLVTAALVVFRFWQIRTVTAPMWGDALQHTVMAQLLLDNGGLFTSWEPYAPYQSLTVQFGFPVHTAVFAWLSGFDAVKSTLIVGQLLNVLAAFTLYPLALRLSGGNRWAGLSAVLIAGLLSPTPAIYTSWGRYAQLAGQAILPVALWMATDRRPPTADGQLPSIINRRSAVVSSSVVVALTLAGMILTYYRMVFYFAALAGALIVTRFGRGRSVPEFAEAHRGTDLPLQFMAGVLTVVMLLPWGVRLVGGNLAEAAIGAATNASPLAGVIGDYAEWLKVFETLPLPLAGLALAGALTGLLRRSWAVAAPALGYALLAMIPAGALIHIPAANMIQSFAIIIALYIPAALLGGYFLGEVAGWLIRQRKPLIRALPEVALAALAAVGFWGQRRLLNVNFYSLVTPADLRAFEWIRQNTPADAIFLVEGFRIYGGSSAVGADAGWWLPLLGGRANTIPPQYALLNEQPVEAGYSQRVVRLVEALETISLDSSEAPPLLCEWEISHVYIGQGQGLVSFGNPQLFSPQELENSPYFRHVFGVEQVRVYVLEEGVCGR